MTSRADEIAKLQHELELLRERRAIYQRGALWVRRTFIAAGIVLAGLVIWKLVLADIFGAVVIVLISASLVLGSLRYRRRGPDLLSQLTISWYGTRGDHREVEEMISVREKRLAEIEGQRP